MKPSCSASRAFCTLSISCSACCVCSIVELATCFRSFMRSLTIFVVGAIVKTVVLLWFSKRQLCEWVNEKDYVGFWPSMESKTYKVSQSSELANFPRESANNNRRFAQTGCLAHCRKMGIVPLNRPEFQVVVRLTFQPCDHRPGHSPDWSSRRSIVSQPFMQNLLIMLIRISIRDVQPTINLLRLRY